MEYCKGEGSKVKCLGNQRERPSPGLATVKKGQKTKDKNHAKCDAPDLLEREREKGIQPSNFQEYELFQFEKRVENLSGLLKT